MLTAALVLLVIAAVGGIVMAGSIFRGEAPPKSIAVVHGLAVAVAIILLLMVVLGESADDDIVTGAFVLSLLTASGGIYLVSRHMQHKPHPKAIVAVHGLLAALTIITLAVATF